MAKKDSKLNNLLDGCLTRREFLTKSSLLTAAGAAATIGGNLVASRAAKAAEKGQLPLSKGVIEMDFEKCIGCRSCENICATYHYGETGTGLSRIRVIKDWREEHSGIETAFAPVSCRQCANPECVDACPQNAITFDKKTGARIVDEEKCIGCQMCIQACPYSPPRIYLDQSTMKAFKCDLCGGDPMCVKVCPAKALRYNYNKYGV